MAAFDQRHNEERRDVMCSTRIIVQIINHRDQDAQEHSLPDFRDQLASSTGRGREAAGTSLVGQHFFACPASFLRNPSSQQHICLHNPTL